MNRDSVIKRLLEQGHVTVHVAGDIINRTDFYMERINSLYIDGNIDASEVILLINEGSPLLYSHYPKIPPNQFNPTCSTFLPTYSIRDKLHTWHR